MRLVGFGGVVHFFANRDKTIYRVERLPSVRVKTLR